MQDSRIMCEKTAIKRNNLSRPISTAIKDGLLDPSKTMFDYGCGHGDDIDLLRQSGFQSAGWDPEFLPLAEINPADIVNLGYVINVIEDPLERAQTLQKAWGLAREILIVSAQLTIDAKPNYYRPYKDGYLTRRGTFQKYYEQQVLREWIDQLTGEGSIPAAPGVFYVFKDRVAKEVFISSRYRRRAVAPRVSRPDRLFEKHRDILQPLMDFVLERGRIPANQELNQAATITEKFGTIKKAFRAIRSCTDKARWGRIAEDRSQDLLIYLALSRFDRREKFSQLPLELQLDVKAFFSTYSRACKLADILLFECGNQEHIDKACVDAPIGKITPDALYVHRSALEGLPPLLRTYEGCARSYLGMIEGTNIIKLRRKKPKISYLAYPDFESDPHPRLAYSISVNLQTLKIRSFQYEDSNNPPILPRKETFISKSHVLYDKFARLTRSEERAGLYDRTDNIGRVREWEDLLGEKNVHLQGHRLVKSKLRST